MIALAPVGRSAQAQCGFFIPFMPDFDQRRSVVGSTAGLPGDGGMYCVPTSAVNILAYLANRGIPQYVTLGGPHNWQAASSYNAATSTIALMGTFMNTSASGGTGGMDSVNGLNLYASLTAPGQFSASIYFCPDACPGAFDFFTAHALGGFTTACYGRYQESPPGFFTRNGGHCVTVNGMADVCSSNPLMQFRDPANDSANATQSAFATANVHLAQTTAHFRGKAGLPFDVLACFRMAEYSTPSFVDCQTVIMPATALTTSTVDGSLVIIHAVHLAGIGLPDIQPFPLPAGTGVVRDLAIHPNLLSHYYISAPAAAGLPCRLMKLDAVGGQSTELTTGADFRFMCFNRFGELYLCDGSVLKAFYVRTTPPTQIATRTLSGVPDAMEYDDFTDTFAVVQTSAAGAGRTLARYDRALSALSSAAPFPSGAAPSGGLSLAFNRGDGSVFVCGQNTPTIFRLTQAGNILTLADSIPLPPGTHPTGLNVNDAGHVVFAGDGSVREYEVDPSSGRWIPSASSVWAGRAAGPRILLTRSRTNCVPALHSGPEWANLADPEIIASVPDCYANCDSSTTPPVLNVLDFACFLNKFAAGDPDANCDGSTTPPALNVLDFACFLNQFAAGCP